MRNQAIIRLAPTYRWWLCSKGRIVWAILRNCNIVCWCHSCLRSFLHLSRWQPSLPRHRRRNTVACWSSNNNIGIRALPKRFPCRKRTDRAWLYSKLGTLLCCKLFLQLLQFLQIMTSTLLDLRFAAGKALHMLHKVTLCQITIHHKHLNKTG